MNDIILHSDAVLVIQLPRYLLGYVVSEPYMYSTSNNSTSSASRSKKQRRRWNAAASRYSHFSFFLLLDVPCRVLNQSELAGLRRPPTGARLRADAAVPHGALHPHPSRHQVLRGPGSHAGIVLF